MLPNFALVDGLSKVPVNPLIGLMLSVSTLFDGPVERGS